MTIKEPTEAFPYEPPSEELKKKYRYIFQLKEPLRYRLSKLLFDKFLALILITFSLPILFSLKVAYLIEGMIIRENSGPLFFFYYGISGGKKIKKYKIRLIKDKYIDKEKAKYHDWLAYSAEWSDKSRTITGSFVKKYYLDELPQFWSVLKGDMSIVGPRPLSVLHYERDLAQGNVSRFLLKGGLLGLGHINKGTSNMGKAEYEYEYIDKYINLSSFAILMLDLKIIYKGILLILKGGGY